MHGERPLRRHYNGGRYGHFTPIREDELSSEIDSPSSSSSADEDDANQRLRPFWPKYQQLFDEHDLHLETVRDVKGYGSWVHNPQRISHPYQPEVGDDAVCPDPGLPERLFRGIRLLDRRQFVAKAVHPRSREFEVITRLSSLSLKNDTMNHTIPVMDILRDAKDNVVFIVMEAWSPQVLEMCCPQRFIAAMRQWLEHIVFMHKNFVAHLDISLRNVVTDGRGRYAYIDFEQSQYFPPSIDAHSLYNYHGTEEPPECAHEACVDPFKIDVWALGVLILRACKSTGIWVPELMELISPMLNKDPNLRPASYNVLQTFDRLVSAIGDRLGPPCEDSC